MKTNFMAEYEKTERISQNRLNLMSELDLLEEYNKDFRFLLKCKHEDDFAMLKENIQLVHKEIMRRFT